MNEEQGDELMQMQQKTMVCLGREETLRSEDVAQSIPSPATHKLSMNAERTHKLPLNTDRTHKLPMNIDRRTSNSTYEYWQNTQKYLWTLTEHTIVPMNTDRTYKSTYGHTKHINVSMNTHKTHESTYEHWQNTQKYLWTLNKYTLQYPWTLT